MAECRDCKFYERRTSAKRAYRQGYCRNPVSVHNGTIRQGGTRAADRCFSKKVKEESESDGTGSK